MPLKQTNCGECGKSHRVCPECDSRTVTSYEPVGNDIPLSWGVMEFIRNADRGDSHTFTHVCWNCGWDEDWTITVT